MHISINCAIFGEMAFKKLAFYFVLNTELPQWHLWARLPFIKDQLVTFVCWVSFSPNIWSKILVSPYGPIKALQFKYAPSLFTALYNLYWRKRFFMVRLQLANINKLVWCYCHDSDVYANYHISRTMLVFKGCTKVVLWLVIDICATSKFANNKFISYSSNIWNSLEGDNN